METEGQKNQPRHGGAKFEKRKHPRFSVDFPVEYYKTNLHTKERMYMFLIIGLMVLVLFGNLLMSILIVGGRADDRMESTNLIEPSTRLPFSAEDKIRIVLEGFHNQIPVSDLCKREGIRPALYYSWVKDFIDADKARLRGDSLRSTTQKGVSELCCLYVKVYKEKLST